MGWKITPYTIYFIKETERVSLRASKMYKPANAILALWLLLPCLLSGSAAATTAARNTTTGTVAPSSGSCKAATTVKPVNTPKLPNPFVFADGTKVASKADFSCRQAEIQNAMEQYELGEFPKPKPTVKATLSGGSLSIAVSVGGKSITMAAKITACSSSGGTGCGAMITVGPFASIPMPSGIAQITFDNDRFADQTGRSSHGKGLFYDLFGSSHSAGALTAWAWGVGRIIDALEQLGSKATGIDPKRVGVTGCSRNGKGAFVIGALEKRIALTIPQESGSGGAACWRISVQQKSAGKHIEVATNTADESWFSTRFDSWASKVDSIPYDHHELAALVAPRGLISLENDIDWLGEHHTSE